MVQIWDVYLHCILEIYDATFLVKEYILVTSSYKYIIYIVAVIYSYLKLHSDSIHSTSHNRLLLDNSNLSLLKTFVNCQLPQFSKFYAQKPNDEYINMAINEVRVVALLFWLVEK